MIDQIPPIEWTTEQRKVKDLVPYNYNPRKITPDRLERLTRSLEKFNLAEIPAVNTDGVIIAGHQRVKVLMELGRSDEMIDVRIPSRTLTEQEFKEYNIISNISVGYWDVDILEECFADIDLMELGLNIDDIEIPSDVLPQGLKQEEEEDFEINLNENPISKTGDVFELKSLQKDIIHRVVCGDSTDQKTYNVLNQGAEFDLVVTDPPYNVDYQGGGKKKLKIKNDSMDKGSFYTFLYLFYSEAFLNSKPGAPIYVFHADSEGSNFRSAFEDAGFKLSQCLIWLKNSMVMGRNDYHWKHEPILYGWKPGAAHSWYNDRKQTTVLEFDRPNKNEEHPTMKPLDLVSYLIKNSSKQKQLVGDLFLGSGSTLISCENLWRNCRGIELDPIYIDVCIGRWLKYMIDNSLEFEITKNGKQLCESQWKEYVDK